jgi:hypothetical protein
MTVKARGTLATVVALLVAGCGNSVTPSAKSTNSTNPASSPTPASGPPVLLVVADPSPYSGVAPSSVRFFKLDGSEVSHVTLATNDQVVGVAGARVFVLGTSGKLRGLHRDGSFEDLADFGNAGVTFAASPDGRRWLWSTSSSDSNTISSKIHLGGDGITPRVIQSASTSGSEARALRPYEWTAVGAFVEHGAVGIGGYIPYLAATGPVDRLDVDKGTATSIAGSATCSFSDMSADGTIACIPHQPQHTLRLVRRDGSVDIPLSTPRFNLEGDAYFSRNGQLLTVAGAVGVGPQANERYGTDLVKPLDASISRLSLEGVRPAGFMRAACWLADGSLVVYRPDNSADGPGVFIVSASGASTSITKSGVPVGVLTG